MSHSTTLQTPNMASLGEVIADIAFTAGNLFATGKLPEFGNSRDLMSDIMIWANQFEEAFDKEVHGDDYIELIDAFAEYRLRGEEDEATSLLAEMNRCKAIRYAPAESTAVPTLSEAQALEMSSQHLPNPAKCALEYLGCQSVKTIELLNRYLDHYFKVQGQTCDDQMRTTCIRIASQRYNLNDQAALSA